MHSHCNIKVTQKQKKLHLGIFLLLVDDCWGGSAPEAETYK